ncbi:MAG: alpha/beta hydrolase [Myxococcota bacterium]
MLRGLRLFLVTLLPTVLSRLRRGPRRPSWSFVFEWAVRMLRRDWDETAAWPLERQRAVTAARQYPAPHLKQVTAHDERVGGVDVRRFVPARPGTTKVVFFHGGSYIYGSTRHSHAELCAHLAFETSLEVVGVEYRLAPEHRWPAQLDDALAVCRALAGPLLLAGDSSGGHLAAKTAAALEPKPRGLVLLSPWSDLEMPGRSFVTNAEFDFGTREVLVRHAAALSGDTPLSELRLEPFEGMPPTFVSVGTAEITLDDELAFVERLRAAQVEVTLHEAVDLPHNPTLFAAFHPNGQAAFDAMVSWVRARCG